MSNRLHNRSYSSSQREEIERRWERYCAQRQKEGRVTLANADDHYFFLELIEEFTSNGDPELVLEALYNKEIYS